MQSRASLIPSIPASVIAGALAFSPSAWADVTQGNIIAVFGNVALAGNELNYPSAGQSTYVDNTRTAIFSISNSVDTTSSGGFQTVGSVLSWGDASGAGGGPSTLVFQGAPTPLAAGIPFTVGRFSYSNGGSSLGSLIFSASISFYAGTVSAANYLGRDTAVINTTSNLGRSVAEDSDYLNICGTLSNICGTSLNAIESSEGGTGLTVVLGGSIVGDPQLILSSVALAPGQSSTGNGFLSNDPPLAVPEPASLALALGGLAGCLGFARRRTKR